MRVKVSPDKTRIIDCGAESHDKRIHAVEISDERSHKHFVTVFTKKRYPDYEIIHSGHNPELYHREGKPTVWVFKHWIPTEKQPYSGWGAHYHILLDAEPNFEAFGVFFTGMSAYLIDAVRDHFDACTR